MVTSPHESQRIGCLVLPLSIIAGFTVVTLFTAAIGFSEFTSTMVGLMGAAVTALIVWRALRKIRRAGNG